MNGPSGNASTASGAVVVDKTYDLVLWLIRKVEKLPKSYRFSVGQRLISAAFFRDGEPGCGVRAGQTPLPGHASMQYPRRFA